MSSLAARLPAELARHLETGQIKTGRELVEEKKRAERHAPEDEVLATATSLDALLGGGLRRGSLVEVQGRGSSGRFSLVLATLAAVTARGEAAALVDLGDGLDPRRAAACGVELPRLLWARPRRLKEALASVESLLDAALPLVVLDLGIPPVPGGRGAEAFWLRLGRAARAQRVALLVSSPYRVSGTAADAVVEARDRRRQTRRALWHGRGREPRLLGGVESRLDLLKGPGWRHGRSEELRLRTPTPVAVANEGVADVDEGTTPRETTDDGGSRRGNERIADIRLWQKGRRRSQGRSKQGRSKTTATPPPDPLMRRAGPP